MSLKKVQLSFIDKSSTFSLQLKTSDANENNCFFFIFDLLHHQQIKMTKKLIVIIYPE